MIKPSKHRQKQKSKTAPPPMQTISAKQEDWCNCPDAAPEQHQTTLQPPNKQGGRTSAASWSSKQQEETKFYLFVENPDSDDTDKISQSNDNSAEEVKRVAGSSSSASANRRRKQLSGSSSARSGNSTNLSFQQQLTSAAAQKQAADRLEQEALQHWKTTKMSQSSWLWNSPKRLARWMRHREDDLQIAIHQDFQSSLECRRCGLVLFQAIIDQIHFSVQQSFTKAHTRLQRLVPDQDLSDRCVVCTSSAKSQAYGMEQGELLWISEDPMDKTKKNLLLGSSCQPLPAGVNKQKPFSVDGAQTGGRTPPATTRTTPLEEDEEATVVTLQSVWNHMKKNHMFVSHDKMILQWQSFQYKWRDVLRQTVVDKAMKRYKFSQSLNWLSFISASCSSHLAVQQGCSPSSDLVEHPPCLLPSPSRDTSTLGGNRKLQQQLSPPLANSAASKNQNAVKAESTTTTTQFVPFDLDLLKQSPQFEADVHVTVQKLIAEFYTIVPEPTLHLLWICYRLCHLHEDVCSFHKLSRTVTSVKEYEELDSIICSKKKTMNKLLPFVTNAFEGYCSWSCRNWQTV